MEREQTFQTSDGVRLSYRQSKRGGDTVLLMLHGVASNSTRWSEFVQHLQLKPEWDLLRLDLRGHGHSHYRGSIGHAVWAKDLAELLQQLGYQRVILVGHSLGAQLALHFSSAYPQLSAGLVLIDPIFPDCLQGKLAAVARLRPLFWLLIRLVWLLNGLGLRRRHFPELDLYRLDQQTRAQLRDHLDDDIAKYYARPLGDIKNLPLANYLQDLYACTQILPSLDSIQVPVLVLLSKGVELSAIEATQQHITQFKQVDTVVIDANHWLLTEKPREARQAIEQWCNDLEIS